MRRIVLFGLLACAGCTCGGDGEARVDGPTPYVRCHLSVPSSPEVREVGDLTLRRDGRVLTIEGLGDRYRVAIGVGPTAGPPPPPAQLVILMDGDPAEVETAAPLLSLAGAGAWVRITEDSDPRIVDATVLRLIRAGPVEWIPVPGTPHGRYARVDEPCGLGPDDVSEWSLPEPTGLRVVLSWAGPVGAPATVGLLGVDAGSPVVRRIMSDTDATSGLFAWPTSQLAPPGADATRTVVTAVAPIGGAPVRRADGARIVPHWTLLDVSGAGLSRADETASGPP